MSKIKAIFTLLSYWNMYLDLMIFSFARKNKYEPAEKMCHLPTLFGIAAGILLVNLNFGGAESEYNTSIIWTLAFASAGVNAFFHFHRIFAMPDVKWASAYLVYIYVVSLTAFFIWVFLISFIVLGIIVIILMIAFGSAMTPEPTKFHGNKVFHNGEYLHEKDPGTGVYVSPSNGKVYVTLIDGSLVSQKDLSGK